MKKVWTILAFLLISFACFGQVQNKAQRSTTETVVFVPDHSITPQINITQQQIPGGNGWAQMGTACAGCPSYYYKIQRSTSSFKAENGLTYYYFFFYFFSNSYYTGGTPASTYLQDINFSIEGNWIFNAEYLMLNVGTPIFGAWLRSGDPNSSVQFRVTQMNVY